MDAMDRCRKWIRKRLRSFKRRDHSAALANRLKISPRRSGNTGSTNAVKPKKVFLGEPVRNQQQQQPPREESHQIHSCPPPASPPVYKIVSIGGGGVGKSSMILQFMYDEFVEEYEPTRADSYRKRLQLDGEQVMIDILDTAGQEDYAAVRDHYLRGADGFLFVFSLSEPESMQDIIDIREQIVRVHHGREDFPCVMVGNKADLEEKRTVDFDQVMRWSDLWNISYIETSAKTKLNVDMVFYELLRLIRDHKLKSQKSFIKTSAVGSPTSSSKAKVALDGSVIRRQRTISEMISSWTDDHKRCTVM